jgi:hypothetical protein
MSNFRADIYCPNCSNRNLTSKEGYYFCKFCPEVKFSIQDFESFNKLEESKIVKQIYMQLDTLQGEKFLKKYQALVNSLNSDQNLSSSEKESVLKAIEYKVEYAIEDKIDTVLLKDDKFIIDNKDFSQKFNFYLEKFTPLQKDILAFILRSKIEKVIFENYLKKAGIFQIGSHYLIKIDDFEKHFKRKPLPYEFFKPSKNFAVKHKNTAYVTLTPKSRFQLVLGSEQKAEQAQNFWKNLNYLIHPAVENFQKINAFLKTDKDIKNYLIDSYTFFMNNRLLS